MAVAASLSWTHLQAGLERLSCNAAHLPAALAAFAAMAGCCSSPAGHWAAEARRACGRPCTRSTPGQSTADTPCVSLSRAGSTDASLTACLSAQGLESFAALVALYAASGLQQRSLQAEQLPGALRPQMQPLLQQHDQAILSASDHGWI